MKVNALVKLSFSALLVFSPGLYAVDAGQAIPSCTPGLLNEETKSLDFSVYKGKVILVDFWATWCAPCQKAMPFFNHLRHQYQSDGFEIVAINVDEETEDAHKFLAQHPVDYVQAFDPKGVCPSAFQVKAMPSSYVIDKAGKIRYVHLGYRDEDQVEIRQQIAGLLAE